MIKWVGVMPFTYKPYAEECMATMAEEFKKNVLFIDNTDKAVNRGCMISHNMGWERAKREGAEWLIIISPAIRLGKPGGMDFIKVLEDHSDHYVIHAATDNVIGGRQNDGTEGGGKNGVFGWHFTAFKLDLLEYVGGWDANLSPYGLCDIDLSLRIQKYKKGAYGWNTYPCHVYDTTMGHSINFAHIEAPYEPRNNYFKAKHGRDGGDWQAESYDHPFNDPTKPLSWWPMPPDPRALEHDYWEREPYSMDDNRIIMV